ncbi:M20 family metallopeptidase [Erysipelotrichaceae bacterium HCN-30851]
METKQIIDSYIDNHDEEYIELALDIFNNPEVGNQEYFASEKIIEKLKKENFTITKNIAGHPTGFVAKYAAKKKGPTIGYLCEYDALPDIGHACGHNIYASVSTLSAIALKQVIDEIGGEVILFGTPSEEGGENPSSKVSYVQNHIFDAVDVALSIHPSFYTRVSPRVLATDGMLVEFFGKASHASNAPEKGINALDAGVMFYNGLSMLRQQTLDGIRFSAVFENGGGKEGSIPSYCSLKTRVSASSRTGADHVMEKMKMIASGAAMSTGCTFKIQEKERKTDSMILTPLLDEKYIYYMESLGEKNINYHYHGGLGATDVGNVSHVIPTLHSRLSISKTPITAHTEEFKKAASSEYGLSQIKKGAKALAYIGIDLIVNEKFLKEVKKQHKENLKKENETTVSNR